ncbi:MAG: hypothetical protein QOH20_1914 [Mycobacterium sp.]|nr:hypothetical protein [Mycobacterium sp.]
MDDPVDTDRLAIPVPDEPADPEPAVPSDDFGYLVNDPADDRSDAPALDGGTADDRWEGAGWTGWEDAQPVELDPESVADQYVDQYVDQADDQYVDLDEDRFDAFNANTWHFKAPPTPWYRTRQALIALAAVAAALIALVVSGVLLTIRGPSDTDETPAIDTSSTPTTAATTPETTSALLPPPPPPPPPETSASSIAPPPVYNRPRGEPRQTKPPEIGVTRTPVTRTQISVAPQPRSGSQR